MTGGAFGMQAFTKGGMIKAPMSVGKMRVADQEMKARKQTRQLPTRGGLMDLDRSARTIVDYSKASPLKPAVKALTVIDYAKQGK